MNGSRGPANADRSTLVGPGRTSLADPRCYTVGMSDNDTLESIKRAFDRRSSLMLDNHYIHVDVTAVYAAAAARLGKHPLELTADEQKAAFLDAILALPQQ